MNYQFTELDGVGEGALKCSVFIAVYPPKSQQSLLDFLLPSLSSPVLGPPARVLSRVSAPHVPVPEQPPVPLGGDWHTSKGGTHSL